MTSNPDSNQYAVASAGYSITVKARIENKVGSFSSIVAKIASLGGSLSEVNLKYSDFGHTIRDITINSKSEASAQEILAELKKLSNMEILSWKDDTLEIHINGKLEVNSRSRLATNDELARAYTPGVARICKMIHENPEEVYKYTIKNNCVAVVSDGTAVLGLGDIGPAGAIPVMEGKAVLFKEFAGVNAFPICLTSKDPDEIVKAVKLMAPVFGGINLEDISAPRCFEIEERLIEELDIPVFHDDQHGTAVVVLAGVLNATKLLGKKLEDLKVVVNGFGASGTACIKIMLEAGIKNIIVCDQAGAAYRGRTDRMNAAKEEIVKITNPHNLKGSLADVLKGADMFLGVSAPGVLNREMVQSMNKSPIVFALANPIPEIFPDQIKDIVGVIATGRSDYANQVNNVLCFPGIFRGALDCRARKITMGMKIAAARAIASAISDDELAATYIIPSAFRKDVAVMVAEAVRQQAIKEGVARIVE
jgi:malate dehydrogenase (oxaloacetate-decarboxylating)